MVKLGEFSQEEVAERDGLNGTETWIVIKDTVYNMTQFLKEHPGGPDLIQECAGKDATKAFRDAGHSSDATGLLKNYKIGNLKESDKTSNKKEKSKVNGRSGKLRAFIRCG